ncbi:MAG TPA: Hint domain-containing protein, partial [Candidatus Eisenbacteria bacterium]|nr:Hint domain-containing protein [Candidatus Eisenbacteria bacterium]
VLAISVVSSGVAYAETTNNTNNIEIQNIQVEPPTIKVGDAFTVNATLVNNSPDPVVFQHGICEGPFSVTFDNHVTVNQNQVMCPAMAMLEKIEPGQKTTFSSPGSALTYRAVASGTANATAKFWYFVRNQTDPNSSITNTISKSFLFTISDNNTATKIPNETVPSPLKQLKLGVAPNNVSCNIGLSLIFKAEDGSPACVSPTNVEILISRGWAKGQENNGTVVTLGEGQREGPLLVQKILPDSIQGLEFREYPLATNIGIPITMHVGDTASNGCTVELTLVKVSGSTATFLEKENQNRPCPICLSGNTVIDTPEGYLNVTELKTGMQVWTQDNFGHKQTGTVLQVSKTLVPPTHKMVHLILSDGRELFASPGHPTTDGRVLGDLKVGDILDGAKIKTVELVPYDENYTYDILPSGPTGFYWANGILLKSTLK